MQYFVYVLLHIWRKKNIEGNVTFHVKNYIVLQYKYGFLCLINNAERL